MADVFHIIVFLDPGEKHFPLDDVHVFHVRTTAIISCKPVSE